VPGGKRRERVARLRQRARRRTPLAFQAELSNIDLTSDMGLSHTTIEKSPRRHAIVMQKIADVVKKDLAKRMAAGKAKSNPRKNKPVASGEPPANDRSTTGVIVATSTREN
jgi:hypothetical protein